MSARIRVDVEDDTAYYTREGGGRWAIVARVDRHHRYRVEFSDGRAAEGEASPYFWNRLAYDWVRYG